MEIGAGVRNRESKQLLSIEHGTDDARAFHTLSVFQLCDVAGAPVLYCSCLGDTLLLLILYLQIFSPVKPSTLLTHVNPWAPLSLP